ncbi:MAG: M4 family metallopeptidase [Bacteriovoracia bacterium]
MNQRRNGRERLLLVGSALSILCVSIGQARAETADSVRDGILALERLGLPARFSQLERDGLSQAMNAMQSLLAKPGNALRLAEKLEGAGIRTTRLQHFYEGLEVVGSMTVTHAKGQAVSISDLTRVFDLDTQPSLDRAEAVAIARSLDARFTDRDLLRAPELKILAESGSAQLIYWVALKSNGWEAGHDLLIDAHNGTVIADISHHMDIAPIDVYDGRDIPSTDINIINGAPMKIDLPKLGRLVINSSAQEKATDSAKRALGNAEKVLKYYQDVHGRDSYDNRGAKLVSVVHAGRNWANAYWDSENKLMAYGDGDGKVLKDLTLGVDVVGHENTHGVISSTSKLIYMKESGALNEAFADFLGKMIENEDNWVMGHRIFVDESRAATGIRNMRNPKVNTVQYRDDDGEIQSKPYPEHVRELFPMPTAPCGRANDNCWVHINSTVASHATYLVYEAIGKQKAERLFYEVLTRALTATSGMRDFQVETLKMCGVLLDTATCAKVTAAMAEAGFSDEFTGNR